MKEDVEMPSNTCVESNYKKLDVFISHQVVMETLTEWHNHGYIKKCQSCVTLSRMCCGNSCQILTISTLRGTCANCKRMCHYPYSGSNTACTGVTTYFWFLLASHFSGRPNHLCITSYSIGCPNCAQCHPQWDILKQRCHMNNYQPITIHY